MRFLTALASTAALLLSSFACAPAVDASDLDDLSILDRVEQEGLARATFAGGCFWCMEPPFDKLDGVRATISGYIGGQVKNPTYKAISTGTTGHTEAVQVIFDPKKITYAELLEVFWRNIDPTVRDRQFCDWGSQYRTGVFFHDAEQQRLAAASKSQLESSGRFTQVVTEVTEVDVFYAAEDYHQDYYKKNPGHYKRYRYGCGRDQRLEELWGGAEAE
ncbi:MAG: peptide-methionine (S)-S-oxide reductase MsrA [Acidobacteriota bacterium]